MNITVVPSSKRRENIFFNESILEIKAWKLQEFDSKKLTAKFEVNFSQPLEISQESVQDKLRVTFLKNEFKELLDDGS